MKVLLSIFGILTLLISSSANLNAQSLTAVFSAQVEEDEIDGFTPAATPEDPEPEAVIDQAFFNVQGDDDGFTVYSLVDFDTSTIGQVSAVTSISLDLGQSNAFFSVDGGLEFFLAVDTRAVELTDTARYMTDQANGGNIGAAVVGDAFGTLYPLGTGTYTETMTGDVDTFTLSLDSAGEAFAISQINSGGLLRIIATPADLGVQATYAGAGTFFDMPTFPTLNLTVTSSIRLGDVDMNGVVDFFDIQPFIQVLSTGGDQLEADVNEDGLVNFSDIAGFISILSAS